MDWLDYREKLGIGFDDETKFKFFLTNITTVLKGRKDLSSQITPKEYYKFCLMTGTSMKSDFYEFECYDFVINTVFRHSEKLSDFIAYYIAFINCQDDASYKNLKKEELKNLICNLMCDAHIKYDILEESGNYFIFPIVGSLTWEGNDYLDKIRDNSTWNKTKNVIREKGLPLVLDTIKTISSAFITAATEGVANSIIKNGGQV